MVFRFNGVLVLLSQNEAVKECIQLTMGIKAAHEFTMFLPPVPFTRPGTGLVGPVPGHDGPVGNRTVWELIAPSPHRSPPAFRAEKFFFL